MEGFEAVFLNLWVTNPLWSKDTFTGVTLGHQKTHIFRLGCITVDKLFLK